MGIPPPTLASKKKLTFFYVLQKLNQANKEETVSPLERPIENSNFKH